MNQRTELMARLERLQPVLRKRMQKTELNAELVATFGAVTVHQMSALRHLVSDGPLTMNELASRMEVAPSSVTQLVDRLVQHNLVERVADPHDRRVLRVVVTETASRAVKKFESARRKQMTGLLAPLTDDELLTFVSLAERMVHAASPAGEE